MFSEMKTLQLKEASMAAVNPSFDSSFLCLQGETDQNEGTWVRRSPVAMIRTQSPLGEGNVVLVKIIRKTPPFFGKSINTSMVRTVDDKKIIVRIVHNLEGRVYRCCGPTVCRWCGWTTRLLPE